MEEKRIELKERLQEALYIREKRAADLVKDLKIPKSAISQYLSGKSQNMDSERMFKICKYLNVSEPWMLGYDVPMDITSPTHTTHKKGRIINVLGRVAAGIPIEAVENIIDTEEITEEMAATGTYFGLQIKGDSMVPNICNHDIVIVRQQDDAETGDTVIALVNGDDATCKRLKKYHDGIELVPNNPNFEPIYFSNEEIISKPVRIIGKVVELRRKF